MLEHAGAGHVPQPGHEIAVRAALRGQDQVLADGDRTQHQHENPRRQKSPPHDEVGQEQQRRHLQSRGDPEGSARADIILIH